MIPASKEETTPLSIIPFIFVLFGLFMITTAVNLQVPLYTLYAEQAGYGKAATALVFAAYVFGLIPALLFLGGISDRAGRKPVLLVALSFSLCATLLMIVHPTIQMLFLARLLQGVGLGLSVGTCTAYLIALIQKNQAGFQLLLRYAVRLALGAVLFLRHFFLFSMCRLRRLAIG